MTVMNKLNPKPQDSKQLILDYIRKDEGCHTCDVIDAKICPFETTVDCLEKLKSEDKIIRYLSDDAAQQYLPDDMRSYVEVIAVEKTFSIKPQGAR